ncbi:MAG: LysM peptidoglycan-binding domain-containing protein, partial [Elusimicrobia bacterium]|nr:LysM peptidoglycan-binding domain-containing protein [Elusimicrobiota bacterium]
ALSYGRAVGKRVTVGGNVKMLQEKYEQDLYTRIDPVFSNGGKDSVNAFSMDLGVLWNYRARFFWGTSLLDVLGPQVGLKEKEKLPMTLRTGLGYRDRQTSGVLDFVLRDGTIRAGIGAERWLAKNAFALRMGLGMGENSLFNTTLGFSVNLSVFQIDYGFQFPLTGFSETAGTHRLSFVYRLGRPSKQEVEPGSLEYSYFELQQEKTDLEAELKRIEAERDRLEKVLLEEATQRIRERISTAREGARHSGAAAGAAVGESASQGLQTYVSRPGDTLREISGRYYGNPNRWKEIYEANRDKLGRGGRVKPGTVLLIPGKGGASPVDPSPAKETRSAAQEPEGARKLLKAQPAESTAAAPAKTVLAAEAPAPAHPAVLAPVAAVSESPAQAGRKASAVESSPVVSGARQHMVQNGETLMTIAAKYYGDPKKWVDIYKANKDKVTRGTVTPGQVLALP